MDIWFSSDQHFGHSNIIDFCDRPFDSVEHMDEILIKNWNSVVAADDLVYIVGDLCMGEFSKTIKHVSRLNGRKVLIPGNHDRCWTGKAAGVRLEHYRQCYLEAGISEIIDTGGGRPEPTINISGEECKISHFPYIGDSHEKKYGDKFSAFRPSDEGDWLLHGHIHNSGDAGPRKDLMINVGVDVWDFTPVNIDQLAALI